MNVLAKIGKLLGVTSIILGIIALFTPAITFRESQYNFEDIWLWGLQ